MTNNTAQNSLQRTPLYNLILEQQGRIVPFAGWEMPVQFSGITLEHKAVRENVGMFDISHMGKFIMTGENLIEKLQILVPSELRRLQPGQAQYTVLLNSAGGIIDDIIIYYVGMVAGTDQEKVIMIVNAATKSGDQDWILSQLGSSQIEFQDVTNDQVLIALQGPQATSILQGLVTEDLSNIPFFGHTHATLLGTSAFLARTGYTGEDGWEIMLPADLGGQLWQKFDSLGVTACGLGCRDTLRLEAAMALYSQDIDVNTTPLEAGLGWLVHLSSPIDFIGRPILEQQKAAGVTKRLVGLEMLSKSIARHGYLVVANGKKVGEVTSGTMSPTLGKAIALAYVPTELSQVGQKLEIEIRGKNYPAMVVKKPFYRSPQRG